MKKKFLYCFVRKYGISKQLFVSYFVAISIMCYFTFFIVFGNKGLTQLFALRIQIKNKELIKQEIYAKMQYKKDMVKNLNLESLDLDLLDEQARKVLGYAGKNEIVIYRDKNGFHQNQPDF
jgi:cell division protein FtsB